MTPVPKELVDFARRYTAAWCSQDPARVASHFAPQGSLTINGGTPSVGRDAIAEAARSFMVAFPDLQVIFDALRIKGPRAIYHWTLTGIHTGPDGSGRRVRISGFEEWTMDPDGFIADSQGQFDSSDYERQLQVTAAN